MQTNLASSSIKKPGTPTSFRLSSFLRHMVTITETDTNIFYNKDARILLMLFLIETFRFGNKTQYVVFCAEISKISLFFMLRYAILLVVLPVTVGDQPSLLEGSFLRPLILTKGGLPNGYLFRPYPDWFVSRWHYWFVSCIQKAEVTAPPSKECGHFCTNL